jgi:hypothetical protein
LLIKGVFLTDWIGIGNWVFGRLGLGLGIGVKDWDWELGIGFFDGLGISNAYIIHTAIILMHFVTINIRAFLSLSQPSLSTQQQYSTTATDHPNP